MAVRGILVSLCLLACSGCTYVEEPKVVEGHERVGNKMEVFLNGRKWEAFLDEQRGMTGKKLRASFLREAGVEESDLGGTAVLIANALDSVARQRADGSKLPPEIDPSKVYPECVGALEEKRDWHIANGGAPDAFGKMIAYDLDMDPKTGVWTGAVELCTWIGDVSYYYQIRLVDDGTNSMRLHEKPFAGTLETSGLASPADMQAYIAQWNYKLHARAGGAEYVAIWRNNAPLPTSHPFYDHLEKQCFDLFFAKQPQGEMTDLDDQHGYCLARCDARVVNTGC